MTAYRLVDARMDPDAQDDVLHRSLLHVRVDDIAVSDIQQIGMGAFSPIDGFMSREDWQNVSFSMHTASGHLWPMPITLPISESMATNIHLDQDILLVDELASPKALMTVTSIYRPDLLWEATTVYGTDDETHPGVRRLLTRGTVYLGGPLQVLGDPWHPPSTPETLITPTAARADFKRRGWRTVVGFQTRNPVHRAHEYIQKCALETVDGLFLHPLVGPTKSDDIPAAVRIAAYRVLMDRYYPADRIAFGFYTAAMRYAGPREAVMHALVRRNYGCTHFIVGRDHAGVGSFYGTYDAQLIFDTIPDEDLGITPLRFDNTFYCRTCEGMASAKTCPHPEAAHVALSGTELRRRLSSGENIPPEFSRPEIIEVLREHYARSTK